MTDNLKKLLEEENFSIEEIIVDCELDKVDYSTKYQLFPAVLQKLRKGGKITIIGLDMNLLATVIKNNLITVERMSELVDTSRSIDSMLKVERFLIDNGFSLVKRKIAEEGKYVLTATY